MKACRLHMIHYRIRRCLIDAAQWLPERWRPMSNAERARLHDERMREARRETAPWMQQNIEEAMWRALSGKD